MPRTQAPSAAPTAAMPDSPARPEATDRDSVAARLIAEGAATLARVARKLPSTRGGGSISPSTLYRWCTTGALAPDGRRVRLESYRTPAGRMTSLPAVSRFLDALTPSAEPAEPSAATPAPRTPTQRRKASERATKECERLGI